MADEKKSNLGSSIYNRHLDEGMSQKEAYSTTRRDLNKINYKNKKQKLANEFEKSEFYALMSKDGIKSEWYKTPVKWDCLRNGQQYRFTMDTNPDGTERDPRIEIIIHANKGVELSDKDLLNCMQDVCNDFHVVEATDKFENIGLVEDYPGDPAMVQVDYFHNNGIVNEKASADLYVSVSNENKVPLLKEGRVGFAKILCEAKNDIEIACKYLNRNLPELQEEKTQEEKSVVSDLNKKKEATQKASKAKTTSKQKAEVSID